jgi:RNA binding exosome subunit
MYYEVKIVYAVHTKEDDRDVRPPTHFFSTKKDAELFSRGRGYYGGTATVQARKAIEVDGVIYLLDNYIGNPIKVDYVESDKDKRILQLLKILTDEEIEDLKVYLK